MKIKAAVLTQLQTIKIQDYDAHDPGPDEVAVHPEYVGVCGSDVHFFEHGCIGSCKVTYPFILGHECAGTVTAVGSNVTDLKVGDRVVIEPGIPCGTCDFCRHGRYNICRTVKFLSTPPYDGVLRESFNHPAAFTYKLPDNVSTLEGALIEPLSVGLYAARRGEVRPGMKVAILGGGCIGLMTLLACKSAGASRIVVSDLFENRLETAKMLGATGTFNPKTDGDNNAFRDKFTDGEGFDVVFETAGSKVTANQTGYLMKRGGMIVMVGNIIEEVPFSFRNMYLNEGEVRSVFRYTNTFPEAIEQIAAGRINVKNIASDIFDFADIRSAFDKAMNEKAVIVKAIIRL
ncbi:MAG: NAD(P)-dependent alcohol dehydrogenase [Lachnospiraceae bacterium]|jgi:L-iditol 2-dehydrogenase